MRVGFLQFNPLLGQPDLNLKKIETLLDNFPKAKEPTLIVIPELATTGYLFLKGEELFPLAQQVPNGEWTDFFAQKAKEKEIYIVAGVAEKEKDNLYNTALLVGPKGYIGKYRKLHLFYREKEIFEPGNIGLKVFNLEGIKIGIMICFDYFFPEVARTLALANVDVIAHPSNLVLPYCQEIVKTRCLENRIFIVTANRIGREERGEEKLEFTGKSQVTGPNGEVLLRIDQKNEGIWTVEIDIKEARNKNITKFNHILNDRKPLFYFKD